MDVDRETRTGALPPPIGMHPDWDRWPAESKVVSIGGVVWMLCTDGAYWVRMDGRGMLLPATFECDECGCPLHPHSRKNSCPVHEEEPQRSGR